MTPKPHSDRVRVRRHHERGHYDMSTIHDILDTMPICSVGYVVDSRPNVTPTLQWREDEHALPIWDGVLPVRMQLPDPEPDPRNLEEVEMPEHVSAFRFR